MAQSAGLRGRLRRGAKHEEAPPPTPPKAAKKATSSVPTDQDHLTFYSDVIDERVVAGEATAVGNSHRPAWRKFGQQQFDYLIKHGLQPHHRMLEIGCGNLRAGWLFIDYLDTANYYGFDISKEVIFSAQQTLTERGLTAKMPYLTLVRDMHFSFLPDETFDVVHAHSVFSHSPLNVIEECFAHVGRVMKPGAFFDFTFHRNEKREFDKNREDFWYRSKTLLSTAERHGFTAEFMQDWEELAHPQSKIRITR
jgi:ubiquinone/menaquinone biosynthesis C-methylase UbiE